MSGSLIIAKRIRPFVIQGLKNSNLKNTLNNFKNLISVSFFESYKLNKKA